MRLSVVSPFGQETAVSLDRRISSLNATTESVASSRKRLRRLHEAKSPHLGGDCARRRICAMRRTVTARLARTPKPQKPYTVRRGEKKRIVRGGKEPASHRRDGAFAGLRLFFLAPFSTVSFRRAEGNRSAAENEVVGSTRSWSRRDHNCPEHCIPGSKDTHLLFVVSPHQIEEKRRFANT